MPLFGRLIYYLSMSLKCYKCFRSIQSCFCSQISPVDPGIKFVFLMHPHEAFKEKTGTGRLASLSLINSEIIIDSSFDQNIRTQELISDSAYFPMVLYPGKEVQYAESFNFQLLVKNKTLLIFLIDATWVMARKMMYRSPSLQTLPKLSFSKEYRSQFLIKKQPEDYCLSTIESSYYLIKELQKSGASNPAVNVEGLLGIFNTMIQYQLDSKKKRLKNPRI